MVEAIFCHRPGGFPSMWASYQNYEPHKMEKTCAMMGNSKGRWPHVAPPHLGTPHLTALHRSALLLGCAESPLRSPASGASAPHAAAKPRETHHGRPLPASHGEARPCIDKQSMELGGQSQHIDFLIKHHSIGSWNFGAFVIFCWGFPPTSSYLILAFSITSCAMPWPSQNRPFEIPIRRCKPT